MTSEARTKVAERLDGDERNQIPLTDSLGRQQGTTIINESGLYVGHFPDSLISQPPRWPKLDNEMLLSLSSAHKSIANYRLTRQIDGLGQTCNTRAIQKGVSQNATP